MAGQAEKFKIGLFVVTSLLLGVGVVIWLGASRYLESSKTVVAYFSESVQGLETDSPVKFRGVSVGRVNSIRLAPGGRLIEVVIRLDKNFNVTPDLGIKVNLLGLTGQKYLEMDTMSQDQKREPIHLNFEPRYPVITTYPSDIREIGNALDNVFQKLKALDVERISYHLGRVSEKLDKMLSDPKLDTLGTDTAQAVREIRDTARKLNEEITRAQFGKGVNRALDKSGEMLNEATEAARSANRMVRRTDNNLNRLSQKLDRVADNLEKFSRRINEAPLGTIFGWGGEKQDKKK